MGYGRATRLRAETYFGVQARTRVTGYVGYFLSPFDFLNDLLTFFLLRAAFKRLVLPLFLISTSGVMEYWNNGILSHSVSESNFLFFSTDYSNTPIFQYSNNP